MSNDGDEEYRIGYGRPPLNRRFERGRSGNPRGRPRGSYELSTILERAVSEKVVVKQGERRRKISKREAMLTQLANKAAAGDHRSIQLLVALLQQIEVRREASSPQWRELDTADESVLAGIVERINATTKASGGSDDGD
jgi:hypothetical protein